jgi:conjugal transfer pilus assembly protein TraD
VNWKLDRPWRAAYEAYSAAGWMCAAATCVQAMVRTSLPHDALVLLATAALSLCAWRILQALFVWRIRMSLEGRGVQWISSDSVHRKMLARPNHVWVGWGFNWSRSHMQRLYDLEKLDVERLRVPGASLWRRLTNRSTPQKGNALLHGVEAIERDLYVPLSDLEGHLFCAATTGAIKTRLLALLAVQAIRREPRETVVVIDPKGDTELREFIRAECRAAGREQNFAFFHRAFPAESFRLDMLANWTHTTQIASRIGALIPSESGSDPWSAFGWRVLNLVAEGCVATHGERPTLTTIRRYVEGGVDDLLRRTLVKHFEHEGVDWQAGIQPYLRQVGRNARSNPGTSAETTALVALYRNESDRQNAIGLIDGLISMWEHDRIHAQKMLASLLPILTMLTAGDLAALLSPDRSDATDSRPILNGASIADSGAVVYVGLDALSDAVVAFAIASIFMADLTSHAGYRHNLGISSPRVNIFADEANECVNIPFIQSLNKSRSAGYRIVFFSQTVSDFVAKLGSEALARQVLANANSIVAGRTKDRVTSEYVLENFGRTVLQTVQSHQGTNLLADGKVLNFTGSYGERLTEALSELVPQEALSRLPDLEYFASFSGSRIVKGRIPLVRPSRRA